MSKYILRSIYQNLHYGNKNGQNFILEDIRFTSEKFMKAIRKIFAARFTNVTFNFQRQNYLIETPNAPKIFVNPWQNDEKKYPPINKAFKCSMFALMKQISHCSYKRKVGE